MKKYIIEFILLILQLITFYILPLFAGPTDAMGLVILIILITLILSLILGAFSRKKIKFFYPIAVAILFLPSIPLFYNSSALIHSVWYLVISCAGLLSATLISTMIKIIFSELR